MPRIERLAVQGFRSFGPELQVLEFDAPLAVVWGPNSEGKTSLAEAVEFLLTGNIARRELLASARDEFAGALRNAHLAEDIETFVEAWISTESGTRYRLRRRLIQDYGKREACSSVLEVDGSEAAPTAVLQLGLRLSEPPFEAPVLMNHNLAYLFSAKPQERSLYFKALLEVTDLEDLRSAIKTAVDAPSASPAEILVQFDRINAMAGLAGSLSPLCGIKPTLARVEDALADGLAGLLAAAGEQVPADFSGRLSRLEEVSEARRARAFPLKGFARTSENLEWQAPPASTWVDLDDYSARSSKVNAEVQQLVGIFERVLAIPRVRDADGAVDCPVCETPAALSPSRVQALKDLVASQEGLADSEQRARTALRRLHVALESLESAIGQSLPAFLGWTLGHRREQGFRTNRLPSLVDAATRPLLREWFLCTVRLLRANRRLRGALERARIQLSRVEADPSSPIGATSLRQLFDQLAVDSDGCRAALEPYKDAARPLAAPLTEAVALKSDTTGWADLVELGRAPRELRAALVERAALMELARESQAALRQIDQAKEAVLDEKFESLSGEIRRWWDLLRPGEAAFFSDLGLRPGATRTIDFKAGLARSADRSSIQVRDAIAVFSHSQLHCLGLATFFARAAKRGGFVLLDDPIISIDDDYSAHFINGVLGELIGAGVQVIMVTYEQRTWRAVQERYASQAEGFQLNLDDPTRGTSIVKSSDSLAMMLKAAEPFTKSSVLATRKEGCQRLRDCAERFCKELLVRKRREQGETALISEYTGAQGTLDGLIDAVVPYLTGTDEPGKLRLFRLTVNPGNHDDDVPSKAFLATCRGDLGQLRRKYLTLGG